jgi:tetratricopeptide (TPR) repeat protein
MIMKLLKRLLPLMIAIIVVSCGGYSTDDNLKASRASIDSGDYDNACNILNEVVSREDISARQLSQAAMLYMMINEHITDRGLDALALEYFRKALALNTDSVNALINELSPDDLQYMAILESLNRGIESKGSLSDYEEAEAYEMTDEAETTDTEIQQQN